ncbi:MAG: phosphomannomutase/phosphoglucomutase, partial [Christensenellaceae bacterium]
MLDWMSLKNGTDIRGVAIEGVADESVNLTDEVVTTIARAFTLWLSERTGKEKTVVAVGHDSRLSADRICAAVAKGITESGSDVILTGLSSTPSMFMLLQDESFPHSDGSIMITASHLPFNKNGLKFFVKEGGLEGKDITEILTLASEGKSLTGCGSVYRQSYIEKYSADLVEKFRKATGEERPLAGKRILVDAGNGAGGFYVDLVLKPLGADTTGSQFLEPDGSFPNHIPNPENAAAMRSVCEAVKAAHADFGIIFDTDVDRAGAVDRTGEEINRNRLIALISAILLEERKGTIVTDSVT